MTQAEYEAAVLAAHRQMASYMAEHDDLQTRMRTVRDAMESAEARLRQLARVEVK